MNIDIFNTIVHLKKIPRQGWIEKAKIKNPESVADHSYSMAVITMILSEVNELDSNKTVKMSLLHDLAESITGDITPESMEKNDKKKLENNAMKKILQKLPTQIQENYQKVWQEYQDNKTKEAKFVHDMDKLEMAIQAKTYSNQMNSITLKEFLNSANTGINNSEVKKILEKIMAQ